MSEINGAYIYIRVSTDRQATKGSSLDNQVLKCKDYIKKKGWKLLADPIEDRGVSGKSMNRKAFNDLYERAKEGDVIVVYSITRLGRNVEEMTATYNNLRNRGIAIHSVTEEGLNGNDHMSRFMLHIMFSIAEWEREEIKGRSKSVLDSHKLCGRVTGHVPLGFSHNIVNGKKYQYPCVSEQKIISFIINLRENYIPSVTFRAIASKLNERKLMKRCGGRWTEHSVRHQYLRNVKERKKDEHFDDSLMIYEHYEKYKCPLVVPYEEVDKNLYEGEFDYSTYFSFVYGSKMSRIPSLDTMKNDIENGTLELPAEIEEEIINASNNGLDEDGKPIKPSKKRDKDFYEKLTMYMQLFSASTMNSDDLDAMADKMFECEDFTKRYKGKMSMFMMLFGNEKCDKETLVHRFDTIFPK